MSQPKPLPLCVDLDGTLIRGDLLIESLMCLLRRQPWCLLLLPLWLLHGRAWLKQRLAELCPPNLAQLPYRESLLSYLKEQRATGRSLYLVTASDVTLARAVAEHLGFFDEVLASNGQINLKGPHKADALVERFGVRGFVYAGDAAADLAVWCRAAAAIPVAASERLYQNTVSVTRIETRIDPPPRIATALLRAMRPHQWLKNLLMLVPLLTGHSFTLEALQLALWAMLAFSLCASSVYLLNDLLDLESDREHPSKRNRPLASGALPPMIGLISAPLLLIAAFMVSLALLPLIFTLVLGGYYLLTLAYSLWLKRKEMVDVLLLASLYTLRILAGAAALEVEVSSWLLALSMFLFLSLAMVKRYTELLLQKKRGRLGADGRGYQTEDLETLSQLGIASGFLSVLVMALYLDSETVRKLYSEPQILWLLCPLLLYLIGRIWLLTRRGVVHDDPVVFVSRDRNSLLVAGVGAVLFWLAL